MKHHTPLVSGGQGRSAADVICSAFWLGYGAGVALLLRLWIFWRNL